MSISRRLLRHYGIFWGSVGFLQRLLTCWLAFALLLRVLWSVGEAFPASSLLTPSVQGVGFGTHACHSFMRPRDLGATSHWQITPKLSTCEPPVPIYSNCDMDVSRGVHPLPHWCINLWHAHIIKHTFGKEGVKFRSEVEAIIASSLFNTCMGWVLSKDAGQSHC